MSAAAFVPHLPPVPGTAPSWAAQACGAYLWDASGRAHVDFASAGGAVLLGHADPDVERAAAAPDAADLAEAAARLCAPEGTLALWTPDGTTASAAADALAVRATGRGAVVDSGQALEALVARLAAGDVAAVRIDPGALAPSLAHRVRAAAGAAGALLIVDERGAGLRRGPGGAAASLGLRADLTVWGPGLANGRAIGAVTGEAALLRGAPATPAPSPAALAAAAATLRKAEREDVALHLAVRGAEVQAELERLVVEAGLAARLRVGGDPTAVTLGAVGAGARGLERRLVAQLAARGVHAPGALCVSLAHEDGQIEALLDAAAQALPMLGAAVEARAA